MIERITELITDGESRTVEFKRARNELPGNIHETICAFLNRDGGDLLLGVTDDKLFTENSNRPHGHGAIDPNIFTPYPKNPVIARVFKEIGWADELGSGVRNLFHYCREYCGADPEMMENDVFRFLLPLAEETPMATTNMASEKSSEKIIRLMIANNQITIAEMSEIIGIGSRAVEKQIAKLKEKKIINRDGPDKGGKWKVLSSIP
jgi:ATP-dependent DNA helicase RecG